MVCGASCFHSLSLGFLALKTEPQLPGRRLSIQCKCLVTDTCCRCCFCSVTQLCRTLCDPVDCSMPASLSFTIFWGLLKLTSIESVITSNHLGPLIPFSSCLQSFQASGSIPMSQFFTSGGQSIRASASASVLPMNVQG